MVISEQTESFGDPVLPQDIPMGYDVETVHVNPNMVLFGGKQGSNYLVHL